MSAGAARLGLQAFVISITLGMIRLDETEATLSVRKAPPD